MPKNGIWYACPKKSQSVENRYGAGEIMMLAELKTGELAKIMAIEGGYGLRQKLSLRGIFEGSFIRVISNQGPVTVEVDRNTVSIGRGMARRIRVMRV